MKIESKRMCQSGKSSNAPERSTVFSATRDPRPATRRRAAHARRASHGPRGSSHLQSASSVRLLPARSPRARLPSRLSFTTRRPETLGSAAMTRKATKRKTRAWPAALRAPLEADAAASRGGNRAHARSVLELGALAVAPNSGVVAFPSGATVVVYDPGDDAPARRSARPSRRTRRRRGACRPRRAPPPDAERGSQPFACVAPLPPTVPSSPPARQPRAPRCSSGELTPASPSRAPRPSSRRSPPRLPPHASRATRHARRPRRRTRVRVGLARGDGTARAFAPRERLRSVAFRSPAIRPLRRRRRRRAPRAVVRPRRAVRRFQEWRQRARRTRARTRGGRGPRAF